MAKKNAKKDAEGEKGAAVVKDEGEGNEAEEAEDEIAEGRREPMQVEIGDFVKVKQMLDESTVSAVLTLGALKVEDGYTYDYDENHYWDNVKLLLMVVACAFAMVAQFYPMPFPESRSLSTTTTRHLGPPRATTRHHASRSPPHSTTTHHNPPYSATTYHRPPGRCSASAARPTSWRRRCSRGS